MSDRYAYAVPIQLDAGFKFTPHIYTGAFFQYGSLFLSGDNPCPAASDCSQYDLRFGLGAQYHTHVSARVDPWIGIGAGYEIVSSSVAHHDGVTLSSTTNGFELINGQLGVDFALDRQYLRAGPFLAASLMRSSIDAGDYLDEGFHAWFTLGARGAFDLAL